MAFKIGENVEGKGKLFPVFIADDGNMYTVRMSEEQLDLFQLGVQYMLGSNILLDPTPLNGGDNYRIITRKKET